MEFLNKLKNLDLIYQLNLIAFLIALLYFRGPDFVLFWFFWLIGQGIVNLVGGVVTAVIYLFTQQTQTLNFCKHFFISIGLMLLVGVPICFASFN